MSENPLQYLDSGSEVSIISYFSSNGNNFNDEISTVNLSNDNNSNGRPSVENSNKITIVNNNSNFIRSNGEVCEMITLNKEYDEFKNSPSKKYINLKHGDIISFNQKKFCVVSGVGDELKFLYVLITFSGLNIPEEITKYMECPITFYKYLNKPVVIKLNERLQEKYNTKGNWINVQTH